MSIEDYFGKWLSVIDVNEMQKVLNYLRTIKPDSLCPAYKDIFRAFHLCPYEDCKVVCVGQDPYPQLGIATGICFGNKPETTELSPSLEVIKESCIDYSIPHGPIEFDITLESWCKQGVLMLNSALTCEVGKVNSHAMLWRSFTAKLLHNLSNKERGVVYVLFGNRAQTFKPHINKEQNSIIEIEHPAYYARINQSMPSSVFADVNTILKRNYNTTIEWYKELNNLNSNNDEENSYFFWPRGL